MSTSDSTKHREVWRGGFTAIEMLVGVCLAVGLMLAVAPLVTSLETRAAGEADRTIAVLQGRVAASRLERDLRMATAGNCKFKVAGPLLEATPRQVVFLGVTGGQQGLCIIEWEVVGASLMRRWAPCPDNRPSSYVHSIYKDNKTMLEGLANDTTFTYLVNGVFESGTLSDSDLPRIEGVILRGSGLDRQGMWPTAISCRSLVGM